MATDAINYWALICAWIGGAGMISGLRFIKDGPTWFGVVTVNASAICSIYAFMGAP